MTVQCHVRPLYSVDWGHHTNPSVMERTEIRVVTKSWKRRLTSVLAPILTKPSGKVPWLNHSLGFYQNRYEYRGLASLSRVGHCTILCSFYHWTVIACRFLFIWKDYPVVCQKWEKSHISLCSVYELYGWPSYTCTSILTWVRRCRIYTYLDHCTLQNIARVSSDVQRSGRE